MNPLTELLDAPRLDGAACVGRGELFFAAPSELGMAAEARAICATCPALADCREWITRRERDHPREHGIWECYTAARELPGSVTHGDGTRCIGCYQRARRNQKREEPAA